MMRYVIFIAYEPHDFDSLPDDVQAGYFRDHAAFSAYVDEHGSTIGSAALADADQATTVRRRGDDVRITDGPFAEMTEMIGGYYEVELPDLDHAIAAATLLPDTYSVEIRPTVKIG
jgi:hypothetical protein